MTSKEDDTLPLPALSLEFSADVTPDEDFIPTSQPLGGRSVSKVSKSPDVGSTISPEEPCTSDAETCCIVNDTLQREPVAERTTFDKDKSSDFIPDTETKKTKITFLKDEPSCKKKLPIFGGRSICQAQSSPLWETHLPRMPESPASDTRCLSALDGSPAEVPIKCDKSIAEIIVNDSAETVDLEGSPMRVTKSESEGKIGQKLSASCSIASNVGRCEETQIFDNSSVLLLEQPEQAIAYQNEEGCIKESTSQKPHPMRTGEEYESDLRQQENLIVSECSPAAVADTSRNFLVKEESVKTAAQPEENAIPKGDPGAAVEEQSSVVTRKIDFKLTVTCFVTFNTKTNWVLRKFISKVQNETSESQPKPTHFDHFSDNASDKSKRYSTSSSGSVYSDNHGLPFVLSKRVSGVSDQTDSSEEDLGARMKERRKAIGRTPWSNEYLLPLKLDELIQISIESQQIMERPSTASAMKVPRSRRGTAVSHLRGTSKSSSSEQKSGSNAGVGESQSFGGGNTAVDSVKQAPENAESATPEVDKLERDLGPLATGANHENGQNSTADLVQTDKTTELEQQGPSGETKQAEEGQQETERSSLVLAHGLPVLARWTDKRYYSGVLCGSPKNDRWEVKFDDGTTKAVREDLIMPTEWLEVGALVFALVDDKYISGQIIHMERGSETVYAIELDVKKKKVSAKVADLCLTDVMAGIIREKYKPLAGTPRGKADIDFDNVLSGKRLREQRTPSRPTTSAPQMGSSEAKNNSSARKKVPETGALETIEETSEARGGGKRPAGLKSEGGHLVEDKIASADSPSGNEAGTTPLRRSSKDIRSKVKPRTLSYGPEETRPGRGKSKTWLTADGTPIPGPSGVKFKRKKPRPKEEDADEPPRKKVDQDRCVSRGTRSARNRLTGTATTPESPERSKRKGRVEGSVVKPKTKGRKE